MLEFEVFKSKTGQHHEYSQGLKKLEHIQKLTQERLSVLIMRYLEKILRKTYFPTLTIL